LPSKVKVLFVGNHADEVFQLFESMGEHAEERIPLPPSLLHITTQHS
jgi:hypothetical protein